MSGANASLAGPSIGIFWRVPGDDGGPSVLVIDATPLAEAEAYGAMLTHPRGHYEVWEGWRLGEAGLRRRALPTAIAWSEYEEHPRGRLVFDPGADLFTLYADRRLQAPAIVAGIVAAFGLEGARVVVRSDSHYRNR